MKKFKEFETSELLKEENHLGYFVSDQAFFTLKKIRSMSSTGTSLKNIYPKAKPVKKLSNSKLKSLVANFKVESSIK